MVSTFTLFTFNKPVNGQDFDIGYLSEVRMCLRHADQEVVQAYLGYSKESSCAKSLDKGDQRS